MTTEQQTSAKTANDNPDAKAKKGDPYDAPFRLRVLTPGGEVFNGEGTRLRFRSTDGDVEIHPGYEPSIFTLDIWPVSLATDGKTTNKFAVHSGFMRVSNEEIIILADAAETREKIDLERADDAKQRAEKRLSATALEREGINMTRAELALKRAIARISAKK
jgi:F-type H+-transporting ATPase subunit epsilon